MTVQAIRGVGLCARMTQAGDWAFDYALDLATTHDVKMDIFFFPTPPSEAHPSRGRRGESADLSPQDKVNLEKDMRLYYEEMLGDFINVGFRLCEGDEEPELRRCLLIRKEYDILVVPYEEAHSLFGQRTVEEFIETMPCPTVLVGPESSRQFFINSAAKLWLQALGLEGESWKAVSEPEE